MGLTAEEKEAKRVAKEAKAKAKAKAKRYKAWCRLLKSKDVGVVQTACADNARDFEFLRGPGLASLLKLLKNKVCCFPMPLMVLVSATLPRVWGQREPAPALPARGRHAQRPHATAHPVLPTAAACATHARTATWWLPA